MKLIGLHGLKRSGKNTAGELIAQQLDGVKLVGFADKLKIAAAKALGFTKASDADCIELMDRAKASWEIEVHDEDFATLEASLSGRQYLQNFGNEMRNVFGANFWIDQVLPAPLPTDGPSSQRVRLRRAYPDVDVLVITDVRYSNEAQRILDLGGVVWAIERDGIESDGHASERPLPNDLVDWTIYNDGTVADLERKVSQAIANTLGA